MFFFREQFLVRFITINIFAYFELRRIYFPSLKSFSFPVQIIERDANSSAVQARDRRYIGFTGRTYRFLHEGSFPHYTPYFLLNDVCDCAIVRLRRSLRPRRASIHRSNGRIVFPYCALLVNILPIRYFSLPPQSHIRYERKAVNDMRTRTSVYIYLHQTFKTYYNELTVLTTHTCATISDIHDTFS